MAREQDRNFDILQLRFALERLLLRLSKSTYRDRFILKGGMLVTQWFDHDNRETRETARVSRSMERFAIAVTNRFPVGAVSKPFYGSMGA